MAGGDYLTPDEEHEGGSALTVDYIVSADQFSAAERRAKALGLDVNSMKFERPPYDIAAVFRHMMEGGGQMHLHLSSLFLGRRTQAEVAPVV